MFAADPNMMAKPVEALKCVGLNQLDGTKNNTSSFSDFFSEPNMGLVWNFLN